MASGEPSIRIALVEDYKLVRLGIMAALNEVEGFTVVSQAEDAETGIEHVMTHNPDVVLLDIGLPNMDGIECARQIRGENPHVKIMMLTSYDNEEKVLAALSAGANAYCLKDITNNRLADVIRMVYEGASWLDPAVASIALKVFQNHPDIGNHNGHALPPVTEQLSDRELTTLKLLAEGKSNNQIADEMHVSIHTIKAYVGSILQKLMVNDRVQAAVIAAKAGIV